MPEVSAKSRADFSGGEQENTRVRYDGQIELASRNLLSNPDLRDFEPVEDEKTRSPVAEGVEIGCAPKPSGWGVYARRVEAGEIISRQSGSAPIGMDEDLYVQAGPLVEGQEPRDVTAHAAIARPFRPRVELLALARRGFGTTKGRFRALSYAWIVGPAPMQSGRMTAPAPRTVIEHDEGDVFDIPLPGPPPEGASALALLASEEQQTETAAHLAPLFVQRRLPVASGLGFTYRLAGQFRSILEAPSENLTYIGEFGRLAGPLPWFARAAGTLEAMGTQLSWSFLTEFGWSASQQASAPIYVIRDRKGEGLFWRPRRIPWGALAWRPEFMGPRGEWYALPPLPARYSELAMIQTNDPEKYPEARKPEQIERTRYAGASSAGTESGDQTGMPDPDAALADVVTVGNPNAIRPGRHAVRAVLFDEDGKEAPPSEPVVVDVPEGYTFTVSRPPGGNKIPNAARVTINPATGKPDGWQNPADGSTGGLTTVGIFRRGVEISDRSNSAADEDAALAPASEIDPESVEAFRVILDITRRTSGAIRVEVRFFDGFGAGASPVGFQVIATRNHVERTDVTATFGPSGSGADYVTPAGAKAAIVALRLVGSTTNGARNLDAVAFSFGAAAGFVVPPDHGWNRTLASEDDEEEATLPAGGACVIVQNPAIRHPDLVGQNLNAVSYYGPVGTPSHEKHLLTGYRTPVRAGQMYTLSAYVRYDGVTVPASMLQSAVKNDAGETLLVNAHLVPGALGTAAERRYAVTFTAPAGASFVEIVSGGASDGYVRAMAFQLDEGPVASPYTNQNAESGYRRVTLDTGLPGIPESSRLAKLGRVAAWLSAGAIYTDGATPSGADTSVSVSFRSTGDDPTSPEAVWSAWTADWTLVPRRRYWQIEVQLATTGPTESPLVSWIGVEFAREHAVILRADGSEYPGGLQVSKFPPVLGNRIRDYFLSDSNVSRRGVRGASLKTAKEWAIEGYLTEAFEDLVRDQNGENATGEMTHVVEDWRRNRRHFLHVTSEIPSPDFEDEAYWTFDAPHHHVMTVEGLEAEVLATEPLMPDGGVA